MQVPDVSGRSIAQLISLEGRAAVVTGGARGIGLAIVRRLAKAGASVLVADVDRAGAERAAETVAASPGSGSLGPNSTSPTAPRSRRLPIGLLVSWAALTSG